MFTEGKWKVRHDSPENIFVYTANMTIASCRDGDWIVREDEALANARLIAAAPDMYEALKETLDFIEGYGSQRHLGGNSDNCDHCRIKKMAKLALLKAEGE